jgi:three-Cys-motif partner protein
MPDTSKTVFDLEPHTRAKHEILRRYLQAWFPIMSKWNGRILYIDGFAGPGEYSKGEPGSPLIAINIAKAHKLELKAELVFWFIEVREDRCAHLIELLSRIELPDNIKYEVECSKFDESLTSLFDKLDEQGKRIAPTFAFIDPFGYSDTPFSVIERIMKNKRCEVLITFMSGFLNRFKSDPDKGRAFDLLFGTPKWREIIFDSDSDETSVKKIVRFYQKRLESVAKYVRTFEMINEFNQTIYHLIFCTNSVKGLKEMKRAMWEVDETGTFNFSDLTDPSQTILFELEPNYQQLKKMIVNKFKGKTTPIEAIEVFVLVVTPFRETHFKRQILREMEYADPPEIEIVESPRNRGGTYPKGTIIRFL